MYILPHTFPTQTSSSQNQSSVKLRPMLHIRPSNEAQHTKLSLTLIFCITSVQHWVIAKASTSRA